MLYSQLFSKTSKSAPSDDAINAKLLTQAGFIYKNSAGIYTYLPLGWRVIQKIAAIIREEMDKIGVEIFMPALHDKHYLQATKRWDVDVVFKVIEGPGQEPNFNISWTHEEIIAEITRSFVKSYRDLPFAAYQIQTKFRNEPRAKSGLLRGREFIMKDLYSFHTSDADLWNYYEKAKEAYFKVFERCGLKAYCTLAGGGDFTISNTHEFQVLSPVGEDTIFVCKKCGYAENKEVAKLKADDKCPKCDGKIAEEKSIEVGNIFPLGTKYSEAFDLKFADKDGKEKFVVMGSYGIGLGRVMGTLVEVFHDDAGIIWPEATAPYQIHLLTLGKEPEIKKAADELYNKLLRGNAEVLYDDRDASAGTKLGDADLIGLPTRYLISKKTLAENAVEVKKRNEAKATLIPINKLAL